MRRREEKRRLYRKLAYLSAAIVILVAFLVVYWFQTGNPLVPDVKPSAAVVIDQLSDSQPNSTFWFAAQSIFNDAGLPMYYYGSGVIDVNFYRNLPQRGFSLIIFRVHSALSPDGKDLAFFTNEAWDEVKLATSLDYLAPLVGNALVQVRIDENSSAKFGVNSNFIKNFANGDFRNTVVVMMGCDGLKVDRMAEAFLAKGAQAYISWNGLVGAAHTDAATVSLIRKLVTEGKTIETAVTETNSEVGTDPYYGSMLMWLPEDRGSTRYIHS